MLHPAMIAGFMPSSSKTSSIGIWARPRAPPPPRANPILGSLMISLVNRAPANVSSAKAVRPVNFSNCFIGFYLGIPRRFAKGGDVQYAAAGGQKLAIFQCGSRMKDLHIFAEILCKPFDFSAFDIVAGIALGRHDDCEGKVVAPAHRYLVECSVHCG